jgi:tRNA threonylcarbamoyladenosine biosynthesis protein TsaE
MRLIDVDATEAAGYAIGRVLGSGDVITLSGDLGVGKTSLARGILRATGLKSEAPSPSFALAIPYDPPLVKFHVTHADLYRLDGPHQIEELGLDEVVLDGALIIEWPDRLGGIGWENSLHITLTLETDGSRRLTAQVPTSWKSRWPFQ